MTGMGRKRNGCFRVNGSGSGLSPGSERMAWFDPKAVIQRAWPNSQARAILITAKSPDAKPFGDHIKADASDNDREDFR